MHCMNQIPGVTMQSFLTILSLAKVVKVHEPLACFKCSSSYTHCTMSTVEWSRAENVFIQDMGWRQMAKAVVKKARPERSPMHFVSFFRAASFLDAIPSLTLTDSMSHKDCNNIFCVQKLTYDEASKTTLFSWNLSLSISGYVII